ncbi:Eukaryotic translation initiation factor 3 subunit L [Fasciola hepatica]|uniref:Eukaryotic translation initiation factor 3 subunit L n=1 Tax=Fasciola hepatica TaxID=6192 RepID=A0A4E0RD52_FASHE|nr:Eukaryotic translation initiation factor 3 subunit L [Fasciola hepatica]
MPSDAYAVLKEDVRSFICSFYVHLKEKNITEIESDYQTKFPRLTEQYFVSTRWPSAEIVSKLVDKDPLFLMLYNELYYRHVYAHVSMGLSVEDMIQSYLNYCSLFNALIKSDKPVELVLPNQWLWDIIDEFLYQFQKFSNFRSRQKHKPEDETLLRDNPCVWSIHSVLNVLYSLVEKSSINEQLSYYAKQGDPDEIADEFGRCVLYKMLGFFSLIGLCRLHCLLGDYYTAIKVLENIKISRLDMYHEVPTCHITTGYYVGFSFMMMRRYLDAIRTLSATLAYKSRAIGLISQRADLREYVNKQADQMSCLLGLCLTLSPMCTDHSMETDRRDKFSETLMRLQQLDEAEFVSSFDIGCPKFITPEKPNYAKSGEAATYQLEPQRQQIELFKLESGQQIELLRLRSFLKLYTNMPTSKLAAYLNSTDMHVHMALMAYKYRLRQVTVSDELCSVDSSAVTGPRYGTALNGAPGSDAPNPQQVYADLDFFVDGNMIHVADTTVDRRFSEYFVRHIEMLQQLNTTLDNLERRIHDISVQETDENDILRR